MLRKENKVEGLGLAPSFCTRDFLVRLIKFKFKELRRRRIPTLGFQSDSGPEKRQETTLHDELVE